MAEAVELERQQRQLSRLETLMDVMFALMLFRVLAPLPLPRAEEDWVWTFGALGEFFMEEGSAILMAIIGVILIVVYWLQNNKLLGNLVRTNGTHVAFCIAQLVFLIFYAYGMAIAEKIFPVYSLGLIITTTLLIFIVATIVSFIPARKISRMKPTDAIRGKIQ